MKILRVEPNLDARVFTVETTRSNYEATLRDVRDVPVKIQREVISIIESCPGPFHEWSQGRWRAY